MMSDGNGTRVLTGSLNGRKGFIISAAPGDSIPEGAVSINRSIVADIRYQEIKHRPFSEIWPVYGSYIISSTTWLFTAIGMFSLRRRLKLFSAGRGTSYLFAPLGPTLLSGLCHHTAITDRLLKGTSGTCSTCMYTRAACVNIVLGWAVPTAMTFLVSSHTARQAYTHPVPPLNEFHSLIKELNKVTYKIRPVFGVTLALSTIVPIALSYMEKKTIDGIGNLSLDAYRQHFNESLSSADSNNSWGDADSKR